MIFGGPGATGKAVARDLAHDDKVNKIGLAGRRIEPLAGVRDWIDSYNILCQVCSVFDRDAPSNF